MLKTNKFERNILVSQSVNALLTSIKERLLERYDDTMLATQYAWWMLEAITNRTQIELMLDQKIALTHEQQKKVEAWIHAQVIDHEPLAYLIGWVPFMDFKIICKPPTLIPRPETEEWCSELILSLNRLPSSPRLRRTDGTGLNILDLCTGSGCIAIALAKALPYATLIATDISEDALALARENAQLNKVSNITFIKSDIYKQLDPTLTFDLIVSNPPYIASEEWKSLDISVTKWEDKKALEAPDHGLAILKEIITNAPQRLRTNAQHNQPRIVVEIGYQQGPAVKEIMETAGFKHVEIKKDLAGKDRTVWGY